MPPAVTQGPMLDVTLRAVTRLAITAETCKYTLVNLYQYESCKEESRREIALRQLSLDALYNASQHACSAVVRSTVRSWRVPRETHHNAFAA